MRSPPMASLSRKARLQQCCWELLWFSGSCSRQSGALVLVIHWEERPWIVILSEDGDRDLTTYPSDERTVMNRRGAGRWISPGT